jgi:amidase
MRPLSNGNQERGNGDKRPLSTLYLLLPYNLLESLFMRRAKLFFYITGLISLILLSACRSEPQTTITSVPPTEAPILGARPEVPAARATRTPRPVVTITSETTAESGEETSSESSPNDAGNASSTTDPSVLAGSWLWGSITDPVTGEKDIRNPNNYHVFIHENTISLITNCNFTFGSITHNNGDIAITIDESPLNACPLEEKQFVERLNSAETYRIENGRLLLNLANSDISLGFGAIDTSPPLTWDDLLFNLQNPFHENYCDAPAAILFVNGLEEPYLKAYGFFNVEENTPISFNAPMQIGDNTKSFTSVIILQLQEEGLLSLDDSLSAWLPDITARIPGGDQITLRHLAQNTSNIPDYTDQLIQPAIDTIDRATLRQTYTPQDLVDIALESTSEETPVTPGEVWQNSTTNFILLGLVAEQATGQSMAELYEQRIFNPLGMTDSYLNVGIPNQEEREDRTPIISEGYHIVNNNLINFTDWNTSQGWAGGGIISTAEDMDKYVRGLFNGRLFQSVFTLSEMVSFMDTDDNGEFGQYGLGVGQFANTPYQAWGHTGRTPGFTSTWFYVPASDVSVVLLTNSGSCSSIIDLPASLPPDLFGLTIVEEEVPTNASQEGQTNACALADLPFPHIEPTYETKRIRDLSPFAEVLSEYEPLQAGALDEILLGRDILDIQALFNEGALTSEELVTYYLYRIQTYDIDKLNSVMELNPEAITIAQALDAERAESGPRSPLHGIPVLLKDNIATGDEMHTTAGAYALKDWQSSEDAFLVQQLRDAGAIILGKANLSEWANWMDACMPNGFSTLGGQTRNPYGAYEVSGSSSGSAAAVAANLTTVSVGTETQGSIISPAGSNSVVGLKPSLGLISRDHVIPLLPAQDTPGPIGRSVTDVAVLLSAMTGVDDNDLVTEDAAELAGIDFTQFLTTTASSDLRVGIVIIDEEAIQQTAVALEFSDDQVQLYRDAVNPLNEATRQTGQTLASYGIEIVEISSAQIPGLASPNSAIEVGFKESINAFLADLGAEAPIGTLEEIIALNEEDLANRAPYGQSYLLQSQNTSITTEEYAAMVEENRETAVSALSAIFTNFDLDVLISSAGQTYAPAGFPAITVPDGYDTTGEPKGIVFVGDYLSEPSLLNVAYIYEQATQARIEPDLNATIQQIELIQPQIEETPEGEITEESETPVEEEVPGDATPESEG